MSDRHGCVTSVDVDVTVHVLLVRHDDNIAGTTKSTTYNVNLGFRYPCNYIVKHAEKATLRLRGIVKATVHAHCLGCTGTYCIGITAPLHSLYNVLYLCNYLFLFSSPAGRSLNALADDKTAHRVTMSSEKPSI